MFFFFNATATTEIYTLSLHDALPISPLGYPVIAWEKDGTEDAGLVKIDLLGNRSLAVLRDCLKHINLYRPPNQHLDYHQIRPADDPDTSAMLMMPMDFWASLPP